MAQNEVAVLRRWFEVVWNDGREDLMEELAALDVIIHGVGGPYHGRGCGVNANA